MFPKEQQAAPVSKCVKERDTVVPRAGQMPTSEALDEASAIEKAAERFRDFWRG
jgi:hypothetical protein